MSIVLGTVATHSAFAGIAIRLGYTQFKVSHV